MDLTSLMDKFQDKRYYHEHAECIDNHLLKHFKSEEMSAFHEIISLDFHLDVYFIQPKNCDFNILLSSGLSLLEMTVDATVENRQNFLFAELMILLPKSIEFDKVYTGEEKNSWIISMIKQTARLPHHNDTFISVGQTIQATFDMKPYDQNTDFVGCVLLPSVTFDTDFTEVNCNGNVIHIWSLFPLYRDELEYKLKNGYNGLVDLLNKYKPSEILDIKRKSLIPKKSLWNLFKK